MNGHSGVGQGTLVGPAGSIVRVSACLGRGEGCLRALPGGLIFFSPCAGLGCSSLCSSWTQTAIHGHLVSIATSCDITRNLQTLKPGQRKHECIVSGRKAPASPPDAPRAIGESGVETQSGRGSLVGNSRFSVGCKPRLLWRFVWSRNEVSLPHFLCSLSSLQNRISISSTGKWG